MSSVYRARDRLLERNVALKVMHPHYAEDEEYVERFRHEARSVAQLSHPHIVTVIDRGDDGGQQFIVFEYIDGENLKQLVERSGPLPTRRAVELALAIADALAFAHQHGLVHRDVKPQNVLLTPDGDAKVTDFGIARSLDVEHGMTQTGTVLGTSNYLSPEQASGKATTPSTDVYSLGVVLYELLTAEVPFPGENFVAVAMKHINELPARPARAAAGCSAKARSRSRAGHGEGSRAPLPDDERLCIRAAAVPRRAGHTRHGANAHCDESGAAREPSASRPRRASPRCRCTRFWRCSRSPRSSSGCSRSAARRANPPPHPGATGAVVALRGVGADDPAGDGEHDAAAPNATDHPTRGRSGRRRATTSAAAVWVSRESASCLLRDGQVALKERQFRVTHRTSLRAFASAIPRRARSPTDSASQHVSYVRRHSRCRARRAGTTRYGSRPRHVQLGPRERSHRAQLELKRRPGARAARVRARSSGDEFHVVTPDASKSFAYTLVAVNPGIVLNSLTITSPSLVRTKKSTRASPSHSHATNASTERCCTSSIVSCGNSGG